MVKKIGCVIAYRKNHTNYGTSLVGYSLLKKIQDLGYDVEIINYVKKLSLLEKINIGINQLRVHGIKLILKPFKQQANNASLRKCLDQRVKAVESFKAAKLIPYFHNYEGYQALNEGPKEYDAVVVGSDQVWLPAGLKTKFYNLLFVHDDVRKVSYASSFGVSDIPSFQRKQTSFYLNRFYKISVREQRGKEIVESLSSNKAFVVADPTMLINSFEWEKETMNVHIEQNEPYIFCYFLGNNTEARKAVNKLQSVTGYKIITIRHMDEYIESDESFGDYAPYDVGPLEFVKYISKAEYVCTDSFHCTAFSIQFHRKFMTFYRFANNVKGGRNSRIDSLFSLLDLPKSHIFEGNIMNIDEPISWNKVDEKLNKLREYSIQYLSSSLS